MVHVFPVCWCVHGSRMVSPSSVLTVTLPSPTPPSGARCIGRQTIGVLLSPVGLQQFFVVIHSSSPLPQQCHQTDGFNLVLFGGGGAAEWWQSWEGDRLCLVWETNMWCGGCSGAFAAMPHTASSWSSPSCSGTCPNCCATSSCGTTGCPPPRLLRTLVCAARKWQWFQGGRIDLHMCASAC